MPVRDYSLRETELVNDAIKLTCTVIKDYSMNTICYVIWNQSDYDKRNRVIHIIIDGQRAILPVLDVRYEIEKLIDEKQDDMLARKKIHIRDLLIDTTEVNQTCLQDHMASITIKGRTAIIDLEELLKAIRYT